VEDEVVEHLATARVLHHQVQRLFRLYHLSSWDVLIFFMYLAQGLGSRSALNLVVGSVSRCKTALKFWRFILFYFFVKMPFLMKTRINIF
jgi:hypothetical protein